MTLPSRVLMFAKIKVYNYTNPSGLNLHLNKGVTNAFITFVFNVFSFGSLKNHNNFRFTPRAV